MTTPSALRFLPAFALAFAAEARGADAPSAEPARALIADKCLGCHSGETPKGGLDLTRRASALAGGDSGEALVPGKPDESPLIERVADGG